MTPAERKALAESAMKVLFKAGEKLELDGVSFEVLEDVHAGSRPLARTFLINGERPEMHSVVPSCLIREAHRRAKSQ